jgi:hypothetical protein
MPTIETPKEKPLFPGMHCYVITHVDKQGMRTLTLANQGRNHSKGKRIAERKLAAILKGNTEAELAMVYGPQAIGTFRVRKVQCYAHGDAKRVYFDR